MVLYARSEVIASSCHTILTRRPHVLQLLGIGSKIMVSISPCLFQQTDVHVDMLSIGHRVPRKQAAPRVSLAQDFIEICHLLVLLVLLSLLQQRLLAALALQSTTHVLGVH